jgi:hypothetical protein
MAITALTQIVEERPRASDPDYPCGLVRPSGHQA